MKYTKSLLEKIEQAYLKIGYAVRYEKGSFQSGYCMVESRKIVVVNRFFETEARISTLLDLLEKLESEGLQIEEEETALFVRGLLHRKAARAVES